MNRIIIILSFAGILMFAFSFNSCQQSCVNNILLQTTEMDIQVNNDNLGILSQDPQNSGDTIRSTFKQFYNYPVFRQFGRRITPQPPSFISTAFAADDCPDQEEYITRMDPAKTKLSLNIDYNATTFGLGILSAETNLMAIDDLRQPYLQGIIDDPFLNGGAPTPVTILKDFFEPINNQWVTFQFYFEEINGTAFHDSVTAYIDLIF